MGNTESSIDGDTELAVRYHYKTENGGEVTIHDKIIPHQVLEVSQNVSNLGLKNAFKKKVASSSRQDRALASLAYFMLTSTDQSRFRKNGDQFTIENEDIFVLTAIGYTKRVLEEISRNESLIHKPNEHNHIPLYLAARSGFYDLTKILLVRGSPINYQQVNSSTALHGAAYFGQTETVQLLLQWGADPTISNKWNHTPEDEAANGKIKKVFKTLKTDHIQLLQDSLTKAGIAHKVHEVTYGSDIIAKEVSINNRRIPYDWIMAWHGTKFKYLESIALNGLLPSGYTIPGGREIKPRSRHYKMGRKYYDVENWASAVFVSPSLRYAAHPCYAERVFAEKALEKRVLWCVVLKVFFSPSLRHNSFKPTTTIKHSLIKGEPNTPECRIPVALEDPGLETSGNVELLNLEGEPNAPEYDIPTTEEDDVIVRIGSGNEIKSHIIVQSIMFIKVDFLENFSKYSERLPDMTYEYFKNIFSSVEDDS